MGVDPIWIQFGALGIVGFVVIRIVDFLLKKLNGKLDRLSDATQANTHAAREAAGAVRELTRAVEKLNTRNTAEDRR